MITKKKEISELVKSCLTNFQKQDNKLLAKNIYEKLLLQKIKFPLLEYTSKLLIEEISEKELIPFLDQIASYKTMGGNVILGYILQSIILDKSNLGIQKACEYISLEENWYACDIIGERVFGYFLLNSPELALKKISTLTNHKSHWVVRSIGPGLHYAIKKGLDKNSVDEGFKILLSLAKANQKDIKQGIGWAAKTTAKFHPEIIKKYSSTINDFSKTDNWFRVKVNIGLERNLYVRNKSKINSK